MATGKTEAKDATEQVDASNQDSGDLTFAFYAVGIVINLVMIAAYFIWAFKQWNKK